jgi:hypothetical protein
MKQTTRSLLNVFLVIFCISVILPSNVWAQADEDIDGLVSDSKNDLLVVVGGGLAGAILGLSTLSFVEEPKEHTKNIMVGAAIGIIAGVGYVAMNQATRSQGMMYGEEEEASIEFDTKNRNRWHASSHSEYNAVINDPMSMAVSFRY